MQAPLRPRASIALLAILGMVLTFTVGTQTPAFAATFEVNTPLDTDDADTSDDTCADDAGLCSLRAAIQQANATAGADSITFATGINPVLTQTGRDEDDADTGDLDILEEVTITGNGDTVIDADGIDRAFHVRAGPVAVSELEVTGGDVQGAGAAGAGGAFEVDTSGDALTTTNVDMTSNSAQTNGGAVHVSDGTTSFTGGTVDGNTADGEGGGLWNNGGLTMTVSGTTLTDNSAAGDDPDQGGGSLFNNGGTLIVSEVTSMGGDATGAEGSGGGLLSVGGALDVDGSTFANGSAVRAGGGIEIVDQHDEITIDDTDFTGNTAGINGGGIHVTGDPDATVAITGGRTTGNSADNEGGGFWNASGTMTVDGTFLAGNSAAGDDASAGGGALFNIGGTLTVTNAEITNNSAAGASGSGGGILSDGGTLEVNDSVIDDNDANRAGGGIEGRDGAALSVADTDLTDNRTGSAPGNGGAVHLSQDATLAITGGTVDGNTAAREGGGLWNSTATMTVDGTTISNNTASGDAPDDGGGGIFNNGGTLTVTDATVSGNSADGSSGSGGGIQAITGGSITVTGTTIDGNDATRAGGGIETNGPLTASITTSTLSGNTTGDSPGNGGGLHITGDSGVTIERTTVSGNQATNEGGGLWNSGSGTLAVTNATVTANSTDGEGSQVYSVGPDTTLRFATIAELGEGDGAAALGTGTAATGGIALADAIVAVSADDACDGNITSEGGNVVTDDTCDLDGTGDRESAAPELGGLADNGGPTRTHALGDESDAIAAAVGDCPDIDQRGTTRPDTGCDSGAFEAAVVDAPETIITDDPGPGSIDSMITFRFRSDDDSATFECRLTGDSTTSFSDCTSPQSYRLADGEYRFSVRAIDPAGNVDRSPAVHDVRIDTKDTFDDDDASVFETDIEKLHAAGITRGCNPPDNDEFCPEDFITREQMAAFLNRALDLPAGTEMFDDVASDNIFADDIGALANSDITRGCNPPDNDEFCPDDFVTRDQMAAFLRRGLDLPGAPEMFDDVSSRSIFAEDIGAIAEAGITRGCNPPDNDEFCPDDFVTRGQMAAFLVRAGLT